LLNLQLGLLARLHTQVQALCQFEVEDVGETFLALSQLLLVSLDFDPASIARCTGLVHDMLSQPILSYSHIAALIAYFIQVPAPLSSPYPPLFEIVDKLPAEFSATVIEPAIGPSGCVRALRFTPSREIARAVHAVYSRLLTPQSLPVLQVFACVHASCIVILHRSRMRVCARI
jgi:hypothetical protein